MFNKNCTFEEFKSRVLDKARKNRGVLGCSKMTSNAAVRGELGWWSLSTRREFLMLKYWLGILLMKEERLVRAVYNQSKRENIYRRRRKWVKKIHFLVCKYSLDYLGK